MNKRTIAHVEPSTFKGKRILVRVDFNVPQNKDLSIADDSRIKAALPTIKHLSNAGGKVILVSHLGRPKGPSAELSLKPIAERLSQLLNKPVNHLPSSVGPEVIQHVSSMQEGDISLLENVRFHPEEEKNDPQFAQQLAEIADMYVNDAFGTAHRAHASTEGVSKHLHPALAGFLMEKELKYLAGALDNPARPFATIIGGSKVSSKIGVLESLVNKVDVLVIGGAMAFTFLRAQGKQTGKSLVEEDRLDFCRGLMQKAKAKGVKLILPVDVVCATEIKAGTQQITVNADAIPAAQMGLDLGPQTVQLIIDSLKDAQTILWNGPLGVFEIAGFEKATYALIDTLIELTRKGAKTIIGGGDSVAAIEAKGVNPEAFSHVSTGGGASLEFLEGLVLPGIACLDEAETTKQPAGRS